MSALLQVAQHLLPALLRLAVAVLHRDDLLGAIWTGADDHDPRRAARLRTDAEVTAIDPDLQDVVAVGQRALLPRLVFVLPDAHQARDRARRQAGRVLAKQHGQRLAEVPRGQPAKVEQRQQLRDILGAPQIRRQDLAREALPLALDQALVVHPRRTNPHRPRPHRHRSLLPTTVAHDLGVPPVVAMRSELAHVLLHFDLQRRLDHPLRPATGDLVQRRHFLSDCTSPLPSSSAYSTPTCGVRVRVRSRGRVRRLSQLTPWADPQLPGISRAARCGCRSAQAHSCRRRCLRPASLPLLSVLRGLLVLRMGQGERLSQGVLKEANWPGIRGYCAFLGQRNLSDGRRR